MEPTISGDVAFNWAWDTVEAGNCVFRWASRVPLNLFPPKFVRKMRLAQL